MDGKGFRWLQGGGEYVLFLENKKSRQFSALWDGPSRGTDAVSWKLCPIPVIRDGRYGKVSSPLYISDLKVEEEQQRLSPSASLCFSTAKLMRKCILIFGSSYGRVVSLTLCPTLTSDLTDYIGVSHFI